MSNKAKDMPDKVNDQLKLQSISDMLRQPPRWTLINAIDQTNTKARGVKWGKRDMGFGSDTGNKSVIKLGEKEYGFWFGYG